MANRLEIISRTGGQRPVEVLLIHGICTGASLWEPHFLPAIREAGYTVHAMSLRGHGASAGGDRLSLTTLSDYASDVRAVLGELRGPVVAVGYSLGGAVLQELMRQGDTVAGAVLMSSVPPYGLAASSFSLLMRDPVAWGQLAVANVLGVRAVDANVLRRTLFTDAMEDAAYAAFLAETCDESPIVGLELQGWRPIAPPPFVAPPVLVIGGGHDRIISPADLWMTALYYGVAPIVVPGMSHTMMREPRWREALDPILDWIGSRFPP